MAIISQRPSPTTPPPLIIPPLNVRPVPPRGGGVLDSAGGSRMGRCSCHGACAVQTLGISGDPPGDDCNHQEASRYKQNPPESLWELLGTMKKSLGRQVLCLQLRFSGVLWAVCWGVHLGMVAMVRTQCACGATTRGLLSGRSIPYWGGGV